MNNNNDEGSLELLNRLLERLHQADNKALGSIVLNIYEQGSQHVDHVENQYMGAYPQPLPKGREKASPQPSPKGKGEEMPDVLCTEAAMVLWKKVQAAGYVDDDFQPLLSRTQSALLADAMAERLGIREKWKVFETFWIRTKMYKDYYRAVDQKQFLPFQDKLKQILD